MAFLKKEEIEAYAAEHGLDLSDLSWQQKQKAVADHMRENPTPKEIAEEVTKEEPQPVVDEKPMDEGEIADLRRRLAEAEAKAKAVPQVPVVIERGKNVVEPTIEDYDRAVLIAAPEQRPTQYQRKKYYETVGTEKMTEDVSFDIGTRSPFGYEESGTKSATYKVVESTRPMTATSTMPKYGCMLTYRPTKELCAVAEYNGHRGYLWTHHRLPNIKGMLQQMGVYEEFKHLWYEGTGRIFYLAGLLCVDIAFTNETFRRIQRELRQRDESK